MLSQLAKKVLHITCNMGTRDLPDMYALSPRACGSRALGIHIRQITCAHVTTITYVVMARLATIHHGFQKCDI